MMSTKAHKSLPDWIPQAAVHYLAHTSSGRPIRALAREAGCHASTVLRQVRRFETRRDDPLVDEALRNLGEKYFQPHGARGSLSATDAIDPDLLAREGQRILRRLSESGAVLAVAEGMEKAVVVRDTGGDATIRTAVVEARIAQAMALSDWIACRSTGRIARYAITATGRAALNRMIQSGSAPMAAANPGFAESQTPFSPASWDDEDTRPRRMRYQAAESPLAALARRRDKDGRLFLPEDLVNAGERLREDFELAQMGTGLRPDWEAELTSGTAPVAATGNTPAHGPAAALVRIADALRDLGPGLGDVVLRCCCHLEGLEAAEKRMGWSARSGKIVLRIALQRLKRHYDENGTSVLIG